MRPHIEARSDVEAIIDVNSTSIMLEYIMKLSPALSFLFIPVNRCMTKSFSSVYYRRLIVLSHC